jgi:hypothetical protein
MARKTTGNTTTRSKKTVTDVAPATMEMASDARKESPKKRKNATQVVPNVVSADLEQEIRHRAYELYLQRATSGGAHGDENQDWLVAEREVLSRQGGHEQHSA